MDTERYHFSIGAFECVIVSDGTFDYPHPASLFFPDAPSDVLLKTLEEHELDPARWERYTSPYPNLVIKTGPHLVLVDTGAGRMAPTTGRLMINLEAEGIVPEEIDTVILTHAHPDHIGGNLDGEGKPAFPNARYVLGKKEWDFWMSDPDLSAWKVNEHLKTIILECPRKNLPPLGARLDLVEAETEIVPGIRFIEASGHTPGHMAVAVSSDGEDLIYLVDTVLHTIHLEHPDWYSIFDLSPEKTVESRYRLLERTASQKCLVLFHHFSFPCLGHVIPYRETWQWEPVGV